jgi:hypothetical protein
MKILHNHIDGGQGGIAFNYGIFVEGKVRPIVWTLSHKRTNGNMYKWERGGTGYVPEINSWMRYPLIENALAAERGEYPVSCKEEVKKTWNNNNWRRDDDGWGKGSST